MRTCVRAYVRDVLLHIIYAAPSALIWPYMNDAIVPPLFYVDRLAALRG